MVLLSSFNLLSKSSNHLLRCTFSKSAINFTLFNRRNPFTTRDSFKRRTYLYYTLSLGIIMTGFGYASVPLYRVYCSKYGSGTNTSLAMARNEKIRTMKPIRDREFTVYFAADTHSSMKWKFKPSQKALKVVPGETALAFYTAENPTDKPIVGIATYTVIPYEASKYFNKIQCFCFEEQRLNPHEQVDLPVFFYLDPEINSDPRLTKSSEILLNYTFFEAMKSKFHIPGITTTPSYDDTQNSEILPTIIYLVHSYGDFRRVGIHIVWCRIFVSVYFIKENQSKFVNQRVNEIEEFFGNLCSELVGYTRRTCKLRNNGDEIARILLDYANKEKINRTTSDALRKVSEYFVTVEDYRNAEINRIVAKVVNPLAAYGEEIKHIKNNLKTESAARRKEIMNMRKLEKSSTLGSARDATITVQSSSGKPVELQLHNAMNNANKSTNNVERCVLDFEGRRVKGLKRIITDFIQIELLWHAKALETLTSAYNAIQSLHEEADLVEFRSTLLRSGSSLTMLNNDSNFLLNQQNPTMNNQLSPMISPSVRIRDHRTYRPASSASAHSSMNSISGSRCSLTSSARKKNKNQPLPNRIQQQQQQQQLQHQQHDQLSPSHQLQQRQQQHSTLSHQNDDVTSLFTEGDDDIIVVQNVRDKVDRRSPVNNGLQDLEDDDFDEEEEEGNTEDEEDDDEDDGDDDEDDEDGEYVVDTTTNTTNTTGAMTHHSPTRIVNHHHSATSSSVNNNSRLPGSQQNSPLKSALKTGISKL
ncbi:unnamed protein product [Schistosoma turkestanicum]|nr:unnamed protein product [Schistosoma turkestanicum]